MEVEVVAEKSLEEVEREKLRRAREEGDYLDLTSSQVETVTTPPEREVANEKKPSGRRACPFPRSTLAAHARMMLPGVLRGVLDVSRDAGCHVLHATLREAAVAALECDVAWRDPQFETENANEKEKSPFAAVQELAARVITASPSRNAHTLRQNVALAVALARRPVESAGLRSALETEGAGAAAARRGGVGGCARRWTPPWTDGGRPLRSRLPARLRRERVHFRAPTPEYGARRVSAACRSGALANSGVLDLGGSASHPARRPRENAARDETKTENGVSSETLTETDIARVRGDRMDLRVFVSGATTCLMEAGSTSGRPLARRRRVLLGPRSRSAGQRSCGENRRRASPDAEEEEDAADAAASESGIRDGGAALVRDAPPTSPRSVRPRPPRRVRHRGGTPRAPRPRVARGFRGRRRPGAAPPALPQAARRAALRGGARAGAGRRRRRGARRSVRRARTSSVDGLEALLSTRDAQVHALALRARGRAARRRRGAQAVAARQEDGPRRVAARRLAPSRACGTRERRARDARTSRSARLAKAAPLGSRTCRRRAPLLRAVVDGRPGARTKRGARALEYRRNARLPVGV